MGAGRVNENVPTVMNPGTPKRPAGLARNPAVALLLPIPRHKPPQRHGAVRTPHRNTLEMFS